MRLLTLMLMFTGLLFGHAARAAPAPQRFQLDNGLTIVVLVDDRAPVVVSQVWYKVGSSYEYDGITGVSHMLEHLMFKGTKTLPAGEFSNTIARFGGDENAFTTKHYTAYFQRIAKEHLELCLRLEADRMRNVVFDEQEFKRELEVVKEERFQRTEDQPQSYLYERFNAAAYVTSSNRYPVIGWLDDLNHMRMADAKQWYDSWYAPNNAVLVVVGDVDPQQVLSLAKRYFQPIDPRQIRPLKPRAEITQLGEQRITVKRPAELPVLMMGYKVPSLKTAADDGEAYALEMLAGLLAGGDSARLTSRLVRDSQLAASVSAGYDLYDRQQTLFQFSAIPAAGHTNAELEQALLAEIERIQNGELSADELARVKTQAMAEHVYQQDATFYQAMQIGITETAGLGYGVLAEYLPRMQAVTVAQVVAVAKKYFNPDVLTVGQLIPQAEQQP